MSRGVCAHIEEINELKLAASYECEECIKLKGRWVHLRTCQSCGVTLCCDNSTLKHMTQHNHSTSHHVVISSEPGERWLWCFKDELFIEY